MQWYRSRTGLREKYRGTDVVHSCRSTVVQRFMCSTVVLGCSSSTREQYRGIGVIQMHRCTGLVQEYYRKSGLLQGYMSSTLLDGSWSSTGVQVYSSSTGLQWYKLFRILIFSQKVLDIKKMILITINKRINVRRYCRNKQ